MFSGLLQEIGEVLKSHPLLSGSPLGSGLALSQEMVASNSGYGTEDSRERRGLPLQAVEVQGHVEAPALSVPPPFPS